MIDKYQRYDETSAGLLKWLNSSEEEARKQQSEAIAADPQTLQKQLEDTKARKNKLINMKDLDLSLGLKKKPIIILVIQQSPPKTRLND